MDAERMGEVQGMRAPLSDAAIAEDWPNYIGCVMSRLKNGKTTYGDSSFERPVAQLIDELQQEAEDLAGWGFVLWARLRKMRSDLEELTSARRRTQDAPRVCPNGLRHDDTESQGYCICEPRRDVRMGWDEPQACSAVIGSAPLESNVYAEPRVVSGEPKEKLWK